MELNQPAPPLERRRVVVQRQQLKRLENRTHRDDSRLTMKSQLIAIVAAVLVVGCGKTPDTIHYAAGSGNIEAVKKHLAAGADVNAIDRRGWTPLHQAASYGHKEIVELLIAKGADVNAKIGGETPLHYAAIKGHKELAELLIANGADVNAKTLANDTPLDWTILNEQLKTADLLRKHGGKTGEELK